MRDTSSLRRIRVFHTESFRLAALFAALFLGFAGILITVVYWIVDNTQNEALIRVVESDIRTIDNGFRAQGLPEAIEIIQQRLGSTISTDLPGGFILLQDAARGKLAGNLATMTPQLGLMSLRRPTITDHRNAQHVGAVLGRGVYLDARTYLFVGRDTATIVATRSRILQAFAWITFVTIILAASGGIIFSVQFLRRIDAITRTCNAIVAGRFDDRIALRGSDDELDRLAGAINSMLDRIARLLENLRQVSSDVAHDLRTPLTHLRQRLENARLKSTSTQEYSAAVSRAIEDTDELLSIFTALLRISQIESGTRLAVFRVVSLSDLLRRTCEMYAPVAEDQGQRLDHDICGNICVRGDLELLIQLFSNLIENAIRHTPICTRILVALNVVDGRATASVRDSGTGIPGEEQAKVLRRFYRLSSSRSAPGNGLGLALVAAIAELHNATLSLADNNPGLVVALGLDMTECSQD
jgi:signal transduction histidine kinase